MSGLLAVVVHLEDKRPVLILSTICASSIQRFLIQANIVTGLNDIGQMTSICHF